MNCPRSNDVRIVDLVIAFLRRTLRKQTKSSLDFSWLSKVLLLTLLFLNDTRASHECKNDSEDTDIDHAKVNFDL